MDVAKFLETAKDRDVTVVFEKINGGGIRKMHCTLNPVLTEGKMSLYGHWTRMRGAASA